MNSISSRLATIAGLLVICLGSTTGNKSCTFFGVERGSGSGSLSFVAELRVQKPGGEITDTFERNDQIEFVLTVRNRLDRSVDVDFPTSRTFDFVVMRENTDDVVWQWSDDQTFQQATTTLTFNANETKTFTRSWNQVNSSGTAVSRGTYEARGVLVFDGFDSDPLKSNQQGSALDRFTIN